MNADRVPHTMAEPRAVDEPRTTSQGRSADGRAADHRQDDASADPPQSPPAAPEPDRARDGAEDISPNDDGWYPL